MKLPCPFCGEADATITLNLCDGDTLHCGECDSEFTPADVKRIIDDWGKALAWIATMPKGE